MPPCAVVMNMFHTGLGIARSLGSRGIPVIGLTARRGIFGNTTRYARTIVCADSRTEPEKLCAFLLSLGRKFDQPAVLFPTRDDDLIFLNCFRRELAPYYRIMAADEEPLNICLNKWETSLAAERAGVPAPRSWLIEGPADFDAVLRQVTYPCILKPLSSRYWRQGRNWELVGFRKAVSVASEDELIAEYRTVARADRRLLAQEMVPGPDDSLVIMACYVDRQSNWVAGFNTRKLLQMPPGIGTGCIVQSVECPELVEPTRRLLKTIGYRGIAEVEYKWDATESKYKLIEINPRPWDQHALGKACGVDLIHLAYCDYAGLPTPACRASVRGHKWIAEDTLLMSGLRFLWNRDPMLRTMLGLARGRRIYAIGSWKDPLPLFSSLGGVLAQVTSAAIRRLANPPGRCPFSRSDPIGRGSHEHEHCKDANTTIS